MKSWSNNFQLWVVNNIQTHNTQLDVGFTTNTNQIDIQVLHSIQYREDQEQSMKPDNSELFRQHFSSNIFYLLSDLVILGRLNATLCVNIQTTNMEIKKTCSKVHDPLWKR